MANSCFDNVQITDKTDTTRWSDSSSSFVTPTYVPTISCEGNAIQERAVVTGITAGATGSLNKVYDYSNPGDTLVLPAGKFEVLSGGNMGLEIKRSITIKGAKVGVDARGRSTTGLHTIAYDNGASCANCDAAESTIYPKTTAVS